MYTESFSEEREMLRGSRILVADDEADIIRAIKLGLADEGYHLVFAKDGKEALELFNAIGDFDLIILDIFMPVMNGVEVAKRIREWTKDRFIPIIFLTATTGQNYKKRAIKYGDEFLNKPIDLPELRMRVKNLLRLKLYHDRVQDMLRIRTIELQKALAELERAHDELKEAQSEIIYRLALAAEYKDEDTANHIKRMSYYAYIVAKNLGMSEEECEEIRLSAPMHDIGKIGVPENILLKPAKLTREEFEVVKRHTVIGAKILSSSPYKLIKRAEVIALTHHENYDGTGYPLGLKGEDIPLDGRIVTIADVFDALTSKRPYKEPWPLERALNFLKEQRGRKFDPKIVDAFFRGLSDILKIKAKFSD